MAGREPTRGVAQQKLQHNLALSPFSVALEPRLNLDQPIPAQDIHFVRRPFWLDPVPTQQIKLITFFYFVLNESFRGRPAAAPSLSLWVLHAGLTPALKVSVD